MSGLPEALRIPDGPERLSLPPNNLPVASLIKFQLPPQHKSTVYMDPSDYFSDPPTITTFNVEEIPTPPSIVVKALGRSYLCDPKIKSIVLVHSPAHRAKADRYPVWLATIWSSMESWPGHRLHVSYRDCTIRSIDARHILGGIGRREPA
ncbi:hypothetical protein B0H14DRAFT_3438326 [Mycena olivaceomarginata]|nr:hypothetical protein B0H14DRAFT_3438326 [Mycena olivaceomarginata]